MLNFVTNTSQMLKFMLTLLSLLLFITCKKVSKDTCNKTDQVCSVSYFTLSNQTQDAIYYGIGTNMQEDTLMPGAERTYTYGNVRVTYDRKCNENKESWSTHQLTSNRGDWAFNIDRCQKKSAFRYTDNSANQIKLYDVSTN